MGKITAGIWVMGILIYYIVIFTMLQAELNSRIEVMGSLDPNSDFNDPGFSSTGNPFEYPAKCSGAGRSMNFLGSIPCPQLDFDRSDNDSCSAISGCTWHNYTAIFGLTVIQPDCVGYVNQTAYNITSPYDLTSTYCGASGLQTLALCQAFKCSWFNTSDMMTQTLGAGDKMSVTSIWTVMAWVTTFNYDIGWGNFNWMFTLIAFYLPLVVLMLALYYALPFFH